MLKLASHISRPPYNMPPQVPNLLKAGLTLRTLSRSFHTQDDCNVCGYWFNSSCARSSTMAANAASAASMPDLMALCEPLIRGTFNKPALHPINAPPGKTSLGKDCKPPSEIARAP